MGFKEAFNWILSKHNRTVTISRVNPAANFSIKVSPTNYSRNLEGPENIVFDGREFIITKAELDRVSWGVIRRGDRLIDPEFGTMTIKETNEMYGLGGQVVGVRVRTD